MDLKNIDNEVRKAAEAKQGGPFTRWERQHPDNNGRFIGDDGRGKVLVVWQGAPSNVRVHPV